MLAPACRSGIFRPPRTKRVNSVMPTMFKPGSCGATTLSRYFVILMFAFTCSMIPSLAMSENVIVSTPLGDIEIELLEQDAPKTVANFLNYMNNDRYNNSFIHRSVPGFIVQGGGFIFQDGQVTGISAFPPLDNEFKISNTRGTVAMAKVGGDPNSATSQWFFNLADNSGDLDDQNGGFTVFARVVGDGMEVVDAIAALPIVNAGSPFGNLPVINFTGGNVLEEHLVKTVISAKQEPFVMNAGLNDAWYNPLTDGQGFFITVFPDLNFVSLAWFTYDTDLPDEGESANLGDPGHRWLTAGGFIEGNQATMNITFTSGGLFDTASDVQRTEPAGSDGVITLTFDGCTSGVIDYDITSIDRQGSVPIERVAIDNVALCEALSAPAED